MHRFLLVLITVLVFTTNINGQQPVDTTRLTVRLGTVTTPSITTRSDLDTGIYWPTASQVGITINGTLKFLVDTASVSSLTDFITSTSLSVAVGAAPYATTGTIRLPNTGTIQFRDAADATNITGMTVTANDILTIPGTAITVANDGIHPLGNNTAVGMQMVVSQADVVFCLFYLSGTGNNTIEISDPANACSITASTTNSFNVYWDAGDSRYELENKIGASRGLRLVRLGQ